MEEELKPHGHQMIKMKMEDSKGLERFFLIPK
jgi:hypothetical protein